MQNMTLFIGFGLALFTAVQMKADVQSAHDAEIQIEQILVENMASLKFATESAGLIPDGSIAEDLFSDYVRSTVEASFAQITDRGNEFSFVRRFPINEARHELGPAWEAPNGIVIHDLARYDNGILLRLGKDEAENFCIAHGTRLFSLADQRSLHSYYDRVPDFLLKSIQLREVWVSDTQGNLNLSITPFYYSGSGHTTLPQFVLCVSDP